MPTGELPLAVSGMTPDPNSQDDDLPRVVCSVGI
jgi:hypothetical protein